MRAHRSSLAIMAAAVALPLTTIAQWGPAAAHAPCAAMVTPAYERLNPTNQVQLLTTSQSEAESFEVDLGFTVDRGTPIQVSTEQEAGLSAVHRIQQPVSKNFVYTLYSEEIELAARYWGYVDQGVSFHASSTPLDCTVPVHRYRRGPIHRLALDGERAALEAAGWGYEKVAFHAAPEGFVSPPPPPPTTTPPPPSDDPTFSFAVIPDTQNETYAGEQRMQERVKWILANRVSQDLRWVMHTGDVHNWPSPPDNIQFANMSAWLRPLDGVLPYQLSAGNHDTGAVCEGGSACPPPAQASVGVRDMNVWNTYYPPSRFGLEGTYSGESNNGWRTFEAGGKKWLTLSLEIWPRTKVIDWARQVIATHPSHNVLVQLHEFTNGNGGISVSNGGYGANSPATLWNALNDYPNVVMIFDGHGGSGSITTSFTADDGHKVASMLGHYHDPTYNPTRIVTVDTAAGTISTRVIANWNRTTRTNVTYEYTQYRATTTGMRFVD